MRIIAIAAALVGGCAYDGDDRCGPGEVLDGSDACVCAEGHVSIPRDIRILMPTNPTAPKPRAGCRPCGDNEVAVQDECACVDGFVRGPEGTCVENNLGAECASDTDCASSDAYCKLPEGTCVVSNLGAACASDADCASSDSTHCKLPDGYCTTTGCASNDQCNGELDYGCDAAASPSYCKRPPLGQGGACTQQGPDPACGAEAPLCVLNTCHASGCASDDGCSPSRACCDLSAYYPGLTLCMSGGCP